MFSSLAVILAAGAAVASAQVVRKDSGTYGPALEEVHLFYDEWPTVTSSLVSLFPETPSTDTCNSRESPSPAPAVSSPAILAAST